LVENKFSDGENLSHYHSSDSIFHPCPEQMENTTGWFHPEGSEAAQQLTLLDNYNFSNFNR